MVKLEMSVETRLVLQVGRRSRVRVPPCAPIYFFNGNCCCISNVDESEETLILALDKTVVISLKRCCSISPVHLSLVFKSERDFILCKDIIKIVVNKTDEKIVNILSISIFIILYFYLIFSFTYMNYKQCHCSSNWESVSFVMKMLSVRSRPVAPIYLRLLYNIKKKGKL